MHTLRIVTCVIALGMFTALGCKDEEPESPGDQLRKVADDLDEAAEEARDAGEDLEEAAEEAGEAATEAGSSTLQPAPGPGGE